VADFAAFAVCGLGSAAQAAAALLALATCKVALATGWESEDGLMTGAWESLGVDSSIVTEVEI